MGCHDGCRVVGTASTVYYYQQRKGISCKVRREVCRVGRVGDKSERPKSGEAGERTYQQSSSRTNAGPNSPRANSLRVTTKA